MSRNPRTTTADEFARLYAEHPEAVILGGATDVGLSVTKHHRDLPTIIHIGRVADLRGSHLLFLLEFQRE